MKRRIKKLINYLLVRYVPSSNLLVSNESKRLTKFITDNYNEAEQIIIVEQMKTLLIDYRHNQIKNKELLIMREESELKYLNKNLQKLV